VTLRPRGGPAAPRPLPACPPTGAAVWGGDVGGFCAKTNGTVATVNNKASEGRRDLIWEL